MSISYLTTPKKMREYKQRPPQLELSNNSKINKINNKRKYDETDETEDTAANDANEENNRMHPLRNTLIYKNFMLINKKEKIDKTIFTPKIVSGILIPTLSKGFMRIPDFDYEDYDSVYDADYEDDVPRDKLLMLAKIAEVITNLEKL
jgi:hypothetical protein